MSEHAHDQNHDLPDPANRIELAATQTEGFGGANGKVVDRLVAVSRPDEPALTLRHERDHHPDPFDDGSVETETVDELHVAPGDRVDTGKLEPGRRETRDRVIVEQFHHSPRAYVRHERQADGEWRTRNAWEVHPATGLDRVQEANS